MVAEARLRISRRSRIPGSESRGVDATRPPSHDRGGGAPRPRWRRRKAHFARSKFSLGSTRLDHVPTLVASALPRGLTRENPSPHVRAVSRGGRGDTSARSSAPYLMYTTASRVAAHPARSSRARRSIRDRALPSSILGLGWTSRVSLAGRRGRSCRARAPPRATVRPPAWVSPLRVRAGGAGAPGGVGRRLRAPGAARETGWGCRRPASPARRGVHVRPHVRFGGRPRRRLRPRPPRGPDEAPMAAPARARRGQVRADLRGRARSRAGHGVRGGDVPQPGRVLERRHRHRRPS